MVLPCFFLVLCASFELSFAIYLKPSLLLLPFFIFSLASWPGLSFVLSFAISLEPSLLLLLFWVFSLASWPGLYFALFSGRSFEPAYAV
jgi:hypothetical protein